MWKKARWFLAFNLVWVPFDCLLCDRNQLMLNILLTQLSLSVLPPIPPKVRVNQYLTLKLILSCHFSSININAFAMLSAYMQAVSLRLTVRTRSSLSACVLGHAMTLQERCWISCKIPEAGVTNSIVFVCREMAVSSHLVLCLLKSVPDNEHHHLGSRNKLSGLF